jgi:hypothetical protein
MCLLDTPENSLKSHPCTCVQSIYSSWNHKTCDVQDEDKLKGTYHAYGWGAMAPISYMLAASSAVSSRPLCWMAHISRFDKANKEGTLRIINSPANYVCCASKGCLARHYTALHWAGDECRMAYCIDSILRSGCNSATGMQCMHESNEQTKRRMC